MAKSGAGSSNREWGFLALLLVLCGVLAALQFRWTGELAQAEVDRLGGKETELGQDFCDRFDRELSGSCSALIPGSGLYKNLEMERQAGDWRSSGRRPVFSRIAVAQNFNDRLDFTLIDPHKDNSDAKAGTIPGYPGAGSYAWDVEWPEKWASLKANLEAKRQGGRSAPYGEGGGLLLEFPIRERDASRNQSTGRREEPPKDDEPPDFPPPSDDGPGPGERGEERHGRGLPPSEGKETGWAIFELDEDYLVRTWLPDLMGSTLNPPGLEIYHARVLRDGVPLFESGPGNAASGPVQRFPFNYQGRTPGSDQAGGRDPKWVLEVSRVPDLLEKTVAASRQRNLALAVGVTGLILATGVMLVRQTRRARRLAQAQMDFVANVSHELRTPLTVIRGAAHNLKRGIVKDAAGVERYSGMILQHTDQLNEMVQQVLDFSASTTGKLILNRQPVALDPLLRESLANTAGECTACDVEVEIPPDLPWIVGDAPSLRRVFQNLLVNAAKHGGSGKWIGLRATAGGDGFVEIHVVDRGVGIPKGEQAEIFTAFYRGSAAREGQVRGSGLGLGLVRDNVTAHGGSVSVCSGEGGGATFVVRLPVGQPSGDESAAATGGG